MPLPSNPPRQMRGADGTNAGASGYVPAPAATDNVKLLHGDGTFKAVSNASAATDAQAAAGTSSTTFVTPANAKYAAASVINPRSARGGVAIDGTANSRVFALLTSQTIGTDAFSLQLTFKPTSATQSGGLGGLSSSATDFTSSTANTFSVSLNGGALQIYITGAIGNYAGVQVVGFASTYLNETVQVVVVKTSSGSAPLVYVNGVLTATTVAASSGTAPWSGSVASTYLGIGFSGPTSVFAGPIFSYSLYNLALDQASITETYEGGAVPERFKFGSQVNRGTTAMGPFPWGTPLTGTGITASGFTINGTSGGNGGYGFSPGEPAIIAGQQWLVKYDLSVSGGVVPGICAVGTPGNSILSALTNAVAGTGQSLIVTATANGVGGIGFRMGTGQTYNFVLSNASYTRLGAVVHFDGDLGGRGLTWYDSSTNALNATLTATGVTWTNPSLGSPILSSGITAPVTTDLTLTGGSSGASITLGQGVGGIPLFQPGATPATNYTAEFRYTTGSFQGPLISRSATDYMGAILGSVIGSGRGLSFWKNSAASTTLTEGFRLTDTGNVLIGGTTDISGAGGLKVFGTTAATNTTSGALQVAGGVGVAGSIWVGGAGVFGTANAAGSGVGSYGATPASGVFGFTAGSMTGTNMYGFTDQTATYTVNGAATEVIDYRAYATLALGTNALTNWYGFQSTLSSKTGAGVLTNAYAFYASSPTAATNNYAFFSAGTAPSVLGGALTVSGLVSTPAATTTTAGLRVPHGAAPTSPVNGDIWTTTAGLFVRINGVTVGPLT